MCTISIWHYLSIYIIYFPLFLQPQKTESWFSDKNIKTPLLKKKNFGSLNHLLETNPELNYFERYGSVPELSARYFSLISNQILWFLLKCHVYIDR